MSFSLTDSIHEAVNYARVSTEDQADRKTIENQLEFCTKYCDLHQINLTEVYKDDGITGTIPLQDRPDGRRCLLMPPPASSRPCSSTSLIAWAVPLVSYSTQSTI